jgi:hypothetical protein
MEFALNSVIDRWFEAHPSILWLVQHPVLSIVGCLIGVVLLARLLAAIALLIDRLWLWILKSPILLIKSLFGGKAKNQEESIQNSGYITIDNSPQLEKIVTQLVAIEKQQQQILKEIAQLKQESQKQTTQPIKILLPESAIGKQ